MKEYTKMAYFGEFAKNKGIQTLLSDISIKENIETIEFLSSGNDFLRIDEYHLNKRSYPEDSSLEYIFVIDGSKFDGKTQDNLDNQVALLNINQCIIDIKKMVSYLKEPFPLPSEYEEIRDDVPNHLIIPLRGFKTHKINDDRDFFRMFFFEYFSKMQNNIVYWLEHNFGPLKNKETPFETYLHLLKKQKTHHVLPKMNTCNVCYKKGYVLGTAYFYSNNEWTPAKKCRCDIEKNVYITDLLQFQELLNTENENEALTTQMMLVLEKIFLVNLLRNIKLNNLQQLFKSSAFVLDGSLAVYSHASWLSYLIAEEIYDLKSENEILICGVEKTGNFVDHFKMVDYFYDTHTLEKGMLFFLNDDYIKKHIKIYHSDSYYGEKTYFGKKFFYKNALDKLFVINLAFENEQDKELNYNKRNEKEPLENCQKLKDLLMLLDNFSSHNYPNALSFVSMANDGASLSNSKLGSKVLNSFIHEVLGNKNQY